MKNLRVAVLLALGVLTAGCSAGPSDDAAPQSDESADELRSPRARSLANGADAEITNGPDSMRVAAKAPGATFKVTEESLAYCTVKEDTSASTTKKTVFDIQIDYELDDGWCGCTIEFSAPGYQSTLRVGLNVDD